MTNQALIVVDIQNDYFPGGKWILSGVENAADNAARIIEGAPFFVPDTEGAQLHAKARNLPEETVVLKHFMNPYRETALKAILDEHHIEKVVVVGNMSHMCIDAVTRASDDFGFEATVIHDACATHDLEFNGVKVPAAQVHAAFMAALQFGYASVVSTQEFLA